jgi:hypothetical protein
LRYGNLTSAVKKVLRGRRREETDRCIREPPRQLEQVREEPTEGLAARWGGVPDDYLALIGFSSIWPIWRATPVMSRHFQSYGPCLKARRNRPEAKSFS